MGKGFHNLVTYWVELNQSYSQLVEQLYTFAKEIIANWGRSDQCFSPTNSLESWYDIESYALYHEI